MALAVDKFRDTIRALRRKGATYADLRHVVQLHETITVENMAVETIAARTTEGAGIRVLYQGSWGFASTGRLDEASLRRAAERALALARSAQAVNKTRTRLSPVEPARAEYASPCGVDPFAVPLDKKLDYLFWACQVLKDHPNIKTAACNLDFYKTRKRFLDSEGADIEQTLVESGAWIEAIAVLGNEVQTRCYPTAHHSQVAQAGYEYVKELDLVGGAERIRGEAVALLRARECPHRQTTVILEGSQLALQLHESCGHPVELDRALGEEIAFAGTSFLTPDRLGTFRYGSKLVNVSADATCARGVGSFAYDDEGVPAQRIPIVREGIFTGYLSSRETAARLGRKSGGCMRAQSWNVPPIVRMTNVNLEPGDATLAELVADTKDGILLSTNRSWSIDDRRLNFQFGTEIAWQIRKGKITEVYKNPLYTGITPQFWGSCSGIANREEWKLWGVPNCAKGEPMQLAHTGHGAAPARFEKVWVGRSK